MSQKLSLQQKMLQRLSPQQIQLIQLLEVPTMELEQRIKRELEENPLLEVDENPSEDSNVEEVESSNTDEYTLEDFVDPDDIPEYKLHVNNRSINDVQTDYAVLNSVSFHDTLLEQLRLVNLTDEDMQLAEYIVGNIDEEGYLHRDIYAIVDDLAFNLNLEVEEAKIESLLHIIQSLDPAGVGARSLKECLSLQLNRKESNNSILLAIKIIEKYFDLLSHRSYNKIQKNLHLSQEELKQALDEIHKLNPKPGSAAADGQKNSLTIIPDFLLEYQNGEMVLSVNNQNVPNLCVNAHYLEMMRELQANKKDADASKTLQFMKKNADNAAWFIEAIKARQFTLLHCMSAIIEFQKEYFAEGDITKLKPMILKDIADETNLDISTISRMRQSKYIQTHFGMVALKSLFSEGVEKDNGERSSNKVIMQLIRDIIDAEDKSKPLTDEKITDLVNGQDYSINRRTVSKYREQLSIPVARLRRQL
ncbi:MAG: RNA polymerase factor sigma-54 [Mangrovibacterium sp.]